MVSPGIDEKVAFLSRPDAYPSGVQSVEIKQTHMSWVFLTESHAWKLKKPVRSDYFDFSTLEARRRNSEEEVRLNRRLAHDVYLGVVPLMMENGRLALDGGGSPVEWLVQMRRLPAELMLDRAIAAGTWTGEDLRKVGTLLGRFYKTSPPIQESGSQYRKRLAEDLHHTRVELARPQYGLPAEFTSQLAANVLKFLEVHPENFDERTRAGRIVDAHGDLRPEHICLELQPVIIDCLEFNRTLRILDTASEMSFLKMECERLGAPEAGEIILHAYCLETGDRPPEQLLRFYEAYHACVRAKLAVWHLRDASQADVPKWIERAKTYLQFCAGER